MGGKGGAGAAKLFRRNTKHGSQQRAVRAHARSQKCSRPGSTSRSRIAPIESQGPRRAVPTRGSGKIHRGDALGGIAGIGLLSVLPKVFVEIFPRRYLNARGPGPEGPGLRQARGSEVKEHRIESPGASLSHRPPGVPKRSSRRPPVVSKQGRSVRRLHYGAGSGRAGSLGIKLQRFRSAPRRKRLSPLSPQ
jgi:hypothetical protein